MKPVNLFTISYTKIATFGPFHCNLFATFEVYTVFRFKRRGNLTQTNFQTEEIHMKKVALALVLVFTASLSSTVVAGSSFKKSGGEITVNGPRFHE